MDNNNMRLIDEAIASEPIKNTFRLAWEFMTLNKKFTMSVLALFLILMFLTVLPVVGFIFTIMFGTFSLALQIYVGRLVYETDNIETFVAEVNKVEGQTIIERFFAPALGAYTGWMVIGMIAMGIMALATGAMEATDYNELVTMVATVGLPLLLVMMIFSYVQPLVHANIIMSNNFKEGFFAVFTLFSADVWRRAMQGKYFNYVAILGAVVMIGMFLFGLIFSIVGVIPIINIIVALMFIYLFIVVLTVSAVMAKRIVE